MMLDYDIVPDRSERMGSDGRPFIPGLFPDRPGSFPAVPPNAQRFYVDIFQQIIGGLQEQIALLDNNWEILAVNEAWTRNAALYDYSELAPGFNYLQFCLNKSAEGHSPAALVVAGIEEIEAGGRDSFSFVYHGRDRWEGRAFRLCIDRIDMLGKKFAVATRYDVSELVQLRHLREDFSYSVIEGQADERRRMAGEIHDSTLQLLVGLNLALGQLKRSKKPQLAVDIVAEMEKILGEAQQELRTISYLAHPPLIDEMGLTNALKTLVEGFARRKGLRSSFHTDVGLNIEWQAARVALYRVVQEALSNIHRHAHASDVAVILTARKSMIHAVVVDNGIGPPSHWCEGVGLRSMRARLRELGGRLILRSACPGTMLIASVPYPSHIRVDGDLSMDDLSRRVRK